MSIDYDDKAEEYSRHRRAYPGLVDRLATLVPDSGVVVEVGCGTANHLRGIARQVSCTAVGVDPYLAMLSQARAADGSLTFVQGRAEDLSVLNLESESVDLVFSVDMVHYVAEPEVYAAQAFALLRPGGWFCTATDSEDIIRTRLPMTRYFPTTVPLELERHHPLPDLVSAFRGAGFVDPTTTVFGEEGTLSDAGRFRDKANSVLHLISESEWRDGVARLEIDLIEGPVPSNNRTCLLSLRKPE